MKTKTKFIGSSLELDPEAFTPPELFQFMIDKMTDGAVILDMEMKIIYSNKAFQKISGFSAIELLGNEVFELLDKAYQYFLRSIFSDSTNIKEKQTRTIVTSKTGNQTNVVLSWEPFTTCNGKIEGLCLYFKEVKPEENTNGEYHESKEYNQILLESINEGIAVVDRNEEFVFANHTADEIFGVSLGGLTSRNLLEFIAPDQVSQILRETEKRSQLIKSSYETEIYTPSGIHKYILVTATPKFDPENKQCGTFAIFRDISELKKIQETLKQGELRYRTLFESAQDAIFLMDDNTFVDCNPSTLRMFGCQKHEIIGSSPELFSPEIQPDGQDSFAKSREKIKLALEGNSAPFEWKHRQLRGAEFDTEILLSPIRFDSKPMVLAFVREITDRKRTEEALRQSEQKFRDMTNSLPTTIYESDMHGNLIFANQTGIEWFGMTEEEIRKGVSVLQFIAPQHRQRAADNFIDIIKFNKISSGEYIALKKDGEQLDVFITSRAILQDGSPIGVRGNIVDITQRKKAEETSLKLAMIVESSDDGIIGKTLDGNVSSWNKGAEIIFGYTKDEIIGKPASMLIPIDHLEEEIVFLNKIRNGEHIKHYETVRKKKDGTEFEASLTISPIRDLTGYITGIASIVRDITERRKSEKLQLVVDAAKTLLQSEEKFSKAFHNSPVPVCITTLYNPQVIEVNLAFEEQTGFTKQEILGRSLLTLAIFHDPEDLKMIIHVITSKGFIRNKEIIFHIKNGEKRICLLSSELFEIGGEPCLLNVFLDVTDRRLAEEKIAEAKQRFELMIEQTLVGFIECSTNFIITSWNPSAERIFGYTANEAIGRHIGNLIVKEEDKDERNKLWRDILISQGGISSTNKNETKDGRMITCEWRDTAIIDPKGHVIGIVSLVADISERMEIEETLRSSREQLKHFAQHLQTIREEERVHISRELHDSLGQSLTGLKMYAFNISNKLNAELSGKNLDNVREQAKEVVGIIDSIMQQVRKIAKDLRPRILDEFGLIPAIEAHLQEIAKQTSLKYELLKLVHTIELDPVFSIEVFRIFQEACTNVIRHANATKITVRISSMRDVYRIEVEDDGCGIKVTDISKLNSLGLLGMKERSHVFGGNLEITGVEGKGTKVVLTFPKKTKEK